MPSMEKALPAQSPPPYTAHADAFQPRQLLSDVQDIVRQERNPGDHEGGEAQRLRNFLRYTLSVDYYRRNTTASLSHTDWEHYAALNSNLNDLQDAHDRTHLSATERKDLAPYFWQFLHRPCSDLAIPVECAIAAVLRFFKFQDRGGHYKGSVYGILHTSGAKVLAQKLSNAIIAASKCSSLSPKRWAQKVRVCVSDIKRRKDVFPNDKEFSDMNGTWGGPERVPDGTEPDSHLWQRPYGWLLRRSVHLADFFEHRPSKGVFEA
ncbi:hypothetical protein LTR85_001489 [Meristemomyces frigidus]|nr:hypothetical protein LTR85_001489 [Meristemomyces frigidus]